jgi:hypothetical protein
MDKRIRTAKIFSKLLDSQFNIGGVRFGLDPIIDLIPWVGDVIGALLSLFILHTAYKVGVSKKDFLKMILNIAIDFLVGLIPFLGVIFDVAFKANDKNVKILETYSHGKYVEGKVVD